MRETDAGSAAVRAFRSGDEPWCALVDDYLRESQAWTDHQNGASVTVLCFVDETERGLAGFYNVAKTTVGYPTFRGKRRIPCFIVTHLAVAQPFQEMKIFSQMLNQIVEVAVRSDLWAIYLCVDERNERAIAVYRHKGFQAFADAKPYLDRETDISYTRMILPLLPPA
jgi:GNAT superfamily N-acetyltransferase